MQRKDELIEEYNRKASFCKAIQKKLVKLTDEEVELLFWRYERRMTLRELGNIYFLSKDAINNRINDIARKIQN